MTVTTEDRSPAFVPKGRMSAPAACEEIIARTAPKDGLSFDQAIDDVEELCGVRHTRKYVEQSMTVASKAMLARRELGMITIPGSGYQRMDAAAAMAYSDDHAHRGWRQVAVSANAAESAPVEELEWKDRDRRQHRITTRDVVAEYLARKATRRKSLPPKSET